MFYLYAATDHTEPLWALVGKFVNMESAEIQKDIEILAWSDEGIGYAISETASSKNPTHTYDALCECISK